MLQNVGAISLLLTVCTMLVNCGAASLYTRETQVAALVGENVSVDGHCAGTQIRDRLVVTAAHCLDSCAPERLHSIVKIDGQEVFTDIVECNRNTDVAILMSRSKLPKSAVRIAEEIPYIGEELLVIGNPGGLPEGTVTRGMMSAFDGSFYVIDGAVWFGNSGGGVFNSKGQLIGVTSHFPNLWNPMGVLPTGTWFYAAGLASIIFALTEAAEADNG